MTEAPSPAAPPTFVQIIGPPAVGKMTVGHEIARRTELRLFHNHMTIEPVLRFFDHGTPQYKRLVGEFRQRVIEEVAGSDLPGMIFTLVCAFERPDDQEALERYAELFRKRGGRVFLLELESNQEERLRRNETAFRLAEKASMRDLPTSRDTLLMLDGLHRLNSEGEFDGREDYLRVDNTDLSPGEVAELAIDRFGLCRSAAV